MRGWAIFAWQDGELQIAAAVATAQEGRELTTRLNKMDENDMYSFESIELVNSLQIETWLRDRIDENSECDDDCTCEDDD